MKKIFAVLSFLFLAGCCSDALAADEFGSRFGNSSPYALGNTLGKASDSAGTMGMDDLNTVTPAAQLPSPNPEADLNAITPAAGAELDSEAASDLEADAVPDQLPAPTDNPPVAAQPTSEQLPQP